MQQPLAESYFHFCDSPGLSLLYHIVATLNLLDCPHFIISLPLWFYWTAPAVPYCCICAPAVLYSGPVILADCSWLYPKLLPLLKYLHAITVPAWSPWPSPSFPCFPSVHPVGLTFTYRSNTFSVCWTLLIKISRGEGSESLLISLYGLFCQHLCYMDFHKILENTMHTTVNLFLKFKFPEHSSSQAQRQ